MPYICISSFNTLNFYLLKNNASPYQNELQQNVSIDFLGCWSVAGQIKSSLPWSSEYKTDGLK